MNNFKTTLLALTVLISIPAIGMRREEKLMQEEVSINPFYNSAELEILPIEIQGFLSNYIASRSPYAMARGILGIANYSRDYQNLINNPRNMLSILDGFRHKEDAIAVVEGLRNNPVLPVLHHPMIEAWLADAKARIRS